MKQYMNITKHRAFAALTWRAGHNDARNTDARRPPAMRLRWVAFLCLPILALSSSTPNVDPDIISIGFSAAFAEWASPHADWEGPTILPGVCDDRCVWSQEDDVQYIIEPGFTFHPPGHAATAGLRQVRRV